MMMKVFYFGCKQAMGHYLHDAQLRSYPNEDGLPWKDYEIDAKLAPHAPGCKKRYCDCTRGKEGVAEIHHKDGWTALAFWDRSIDKRGAANSAFFAEGIHDFAAMLAIAKEKFPTIVARFEFEIVEYKAASN